MGSKMKLFIDTWGWVSIHNKREPQHEEVKSFYDNFRLQVGIAYTTDYILDETFTMFFRRLPFSQARESMKRIDEATHLKDICNWSGLHMSALKKLKDCG